MKKINPRKRNVLKSKGGFTLVELMVSFLLLFILMTAAVTVIASSAKVYMRIENVSRAQSVSNMLFEKITGELEDAKGSMVLAEDGTLTYRDDQGRMADIMVQGIEEDEEFKVLVIAYHSGERWKLDPNAYMENKIKNLEFTFQEDDQIKIKIKLENQKTGFEYEREKTIRLYGKTQ